VIPIPWIVRTPVWTQLGPPAALLTRRNLSRPVLWVAAGSAASAVGDFLGRIAAHRVGNNHWVSVIDTPVMFVLYLIALTEWQVAAREKRAFRIGIFVLLVIYVLLIAFVEDVTTFTRFGAMLCSLTLMGGAIWTLLRRAFASFHRPLPSTDWFWVIGGLALYGAVTSVAEPISKILLETGRLDLFTRVYSARAVGIDLSFLLMVIGCLLPPDPRPEVV
jgi:hypothetical protein